LLSIFWDLLAQPSQELTISLFWSASSQTPAGAVLSVPSRRSHSILMTSYPFPALLQHPPSLAGTNPASQSAIEVGLASRRWTRSNLPPFSAAIPLFTRPMHPTKVDDSFFGLLHLRAADGFSIALSFDSQVRPSSVFFPLLLGLGNPSKYVAFLAGDR